MADQKLAPLEVFDARIVQTPLQGLLRNMDSELARLFKQAMTSHDREAERRLSLFLIMLRFTKNSYEAASFLCSTLVFMLDEFPARSTAYELSGYRQAREEYDKFQARYGTHPKWQTQLLTLREWLPTLEKYFSIKPEQKANPAQIKYWNAPYKLMKTPTKSQPFMEFLEKWLYGETSAQAHLNAAGLFTVAVFLISDFAPDDEQKTIAERNFEKYKFRHFSRTLITVLAIATEIDNFCQLKNRETLSRLWVLLGGYAEEADDVYKLRYQAMLV